ncbi:MAG: peptide chain release factor N(5)-glutamine methyltransferase [Acidimicrobiales bacterium]|nr:peptide chain release factor N(5)-glutamine methyltransferase [Acidimicrobiales bacterium]MCB9396023.1 peptide chain release factor N(5)-glutamine methyltransferase [Acidimicrobiaceae bacterium]
MGAPWDIVTTTTVERLRDAGCLDPVAEANELVGHAADASTLEAWVERRLEGEPLAWIVGRVRFAGCDVLVDPGVYVPRPQSAEVARRAAALVPAVGRRVADLCTGSGAIAVHLRDVAGATVVAVDIDPAAVRCARRNGVAVVQGDVDAPFATAAFDVVTAVAPYVPTAAMRVLPADVQRHEPTRALDGGVDGLDVVRRTIDSAARLLRPGGWLVAEVGGDQRGGVGDALAAASFVAAQWWFDGDGDLRGVCARRTTGHDR